MSLLIGLTLLTPLGLAALLAMPARLRPLSLTLAPWAALPAVALGIAPVQEAALDVSWLLLGSRFGLDEVGRTFLLLTGVLWLLAGIYARAYLPVPDQPRYFGFHLLTLAGNLGVVLAHDLASFYLAFLLMTLAAFGLIIHEGTAAAGRAATVYLVMAVGGEGLLLFGFILTVSSIGGLDLPVFTGSELGISASLALLLGFGVKAGLPLAHMWLPLAHPEAPTPASAVLSGAMIKAGLLGWMRFLPVGGETAEPWLGALVVGAGLFAAYSAALVGVTQRKPKALLAYSSISQMGFMTIALGVALVVPKAWPAAAVATAMFAFHHALAKGALFLGVGIADRRGGERSGRLLAAGGLVLAAAALVGLPLTSGALAKGLLKDAVHPLVEHLPWAAPLPTLITLAASGTALLMLRLFALLRQAESDAADRNAGDGHAGDGRAGHDGTAESGAPRGMWLPWLASVLAVAAAPALLAAAIGLPLHGYSDVGLSGGPGLKTWGLLWPALLAIALYLLLLRRPVPQIPPGDVLVPLERLALRAAAALQLLPLGVARGLRDTRTLWNAQRRRLGSGEWLPNLEANLMRWDSAGILLLVLGSLLALALWGRGGG